MVMFRREELGSTGAKENFPAVVGTIRLVRSPIIVMSRKSVIN